MLKVQPPFDPVEPGFEMVNAQIDVSLVAHLGGGKVADLDFERGYATLKVTQRFNHHIHLAIQAAQIDKH
ncbi:MAG: hypothetical protein H7251_02230 [Acetobacteraceae bacterium]|nr:hypothetical protein [Acetobacteraceae bacterium]